MDLAEAEAVAARVATILRRPPPSLVVRTTTFIGEPIWPEGKGKIGITPAAVEGLDEAALEFAFARTFLAGARWGKREVIRATLLTGIVCAAPAILGFSRLSGLWAWTPVAGSAMAGPLMLSVRARIEQERESRSVERALRALGSVTGAEAYYRRLQEYELHGERAHVRGKHVPESEVILRMNFQRIARAARDLALG